MSYIRNKKHTIINILDVDSSYVEREISSSIYTDSMNQTLEIECIYHHGEPECFGADPKFCTGAFENLLKGP